MRMAQSAILATQIVAKGHRQWSRDGKRIVFAAKVEGDAEILSVDVASRQITRSVGHAPPAATS
jgi:Tol biopolymer transport system component